MKFIVRNILRSFDRSKEVYSKIEKNDLQTIETKIVQYQHFCHSIVGKCTRESRGSNYIHNEEMEQFKENENMAPSASSIHDDIYCDISVVRFGLETK